jgi:hypothetical protein
MRPKFGQASIEEVASDALVSIQTVSWGINSRPDISPWNARARPKCHRTHTNQPINSVVPASRAQWQAAMTAQR